MKAVIIAGGEGTRLRPLTYSVPKPIVPVVNLPFLFHQIELLVRHGIGEIILNLHYFSEEIKKSIGDGSAWGIKIYYSIEERPLGTAGAVKNAEEYFDAEPMVIFNGDVLTDLDLSKLIQFHEQKKARVTLTLTEVEDPTPFGLVFTDNDGRVTRFLEKPSREMATVRTINAGTYVVGPEIFKAVPKGQAYSFERQLYPLLLEKGERIFGYLPQRAYWIDIGSPEKYKEAQWAILEGKVYARMGGRKEGSALLGAGVKIGKGTRIKDCVVIGDGVVLGENCLLDHAIIWRGTKIGNNVVLSDCILGYDCVVYDGAVVEKGSVWASGSIIRGK